MVEEEENNTIKIDGKEFQIPNEEYSRVQEEYEDCMKQNSTLKFSLMAALTAIPFSVYFKNYKPFYVGSN
eukprot:gene354-6768_t